MKTALLLIIFIFITNITYSQVTENINKKRLIIILKPEFSIDFKNATTEQKFNHKELDVLNKTNKVQSIKLTGNKKHLGSYKKN